MIDLEIKRSAAPTLSKGFYYACEDINATEKYVIYPGRELFPLKNGVEVMGIKNFLAAMERLI